MLKMFCFGGIAFFLAILALTAFDEPLTWTLVVGLIGAGLLFGAAMAVVIPVVSLITMRMSAKRMFEQMWIGLPITYEMDEQGLRAANQQSTSSLPWDTFCDSIQDERVLLLRRTTRIFFILPKAQLTVQDLTSISSLLRGAGVKES
ncbi:MAG: YcxB family protein [Croceibacterium sp.]